MVWRSLLRGLGVAAAMIGTASAEHLPITGYTTADGLAHERVKCIVADSRGFLWLCGREGLSRFDGQEFTTYGVAQGLAAPSINAILETSRGVYWVATNGAGVYRLNPVTRGLLTHGTERPDDRRRDAGSPSRFTAFRLGDDPQPNRVNALHEDRTGRLWAGTDGGLFVLEERMGQPTFRRVELGLPSNPDRGVLVWTFAEDREGSLWIGTSSGLLRRLPEGRMIHTAVQPAEGTDHVRALLIDRENRIWIGHDTGLRTATLPEVAGAVRHTTEDGVTGGSVRALLQSSDGQIWIATWDGLTQFDGKQFRAFTKAHGITRALALAEDRRGNIWIGTLADGALKLARDGFTAFTEADGLADAGIGAVFGNPAGELFVVSNNQRIHRLNGTRFTAVRPYLSDDVAEPVRSGLALHDRAGEWWIPGGAGLYRFPNVRNVEQLGRVRPRAIYTTRDGLAGDDVSRLFEDSRGDIWIGRQHPTSTVVTRWERATGTFHRYSEADGLPAFNRTTAFAEDGSGNVWIGFQNGGLARYRHGRFRLFTQADGTPARGTGTLYLDGQKRLWVGSASPALTRIDSPDADRPQFVAFTAQGLSGAAVGCMTEDELGRLYLCMSPSRVARLDTLTGHVRYFTRADGLAGVALTAAFRDRSGSLWFGTYDGLFRLVPTGDPPPSTPTVLIGGLRVAGQSYLQSDLGESDIPKFQLEPAQNQLQIEFFGLGAGAGEELKYQYRLEGADRDWSGPTRQRSVNYASLSSGGYRFVVRAVAADGTLSEDATVAFTILRPLWQRWWFVALTGFVIAAGAYSFYRARVGRLLELERVRTRIATDLHDDLGSNLSQIAIQSEVLLMEAGRKDPSMAKLLSNITTTANESVEAMGDIVWAINPTEDSLQDLIRRMRRFASDVFTARGIDFDFRAPGVNRHVEIGADLRREVFLLFKETVNNIVRHSKCTRAEIEMALDGDALLLQVSDNGKGFDSTLETEGNGLSSIRRRARNLGGMLEVLSTPGTGTTIRLRAPLRRRLASRTALRV
jgi:ligand-binding sensor domain-containing protein/signal transduction histidine kinase